MRIDGKTIEDVATSAVRTTVQRCPILSAYISDNDKGPAFDGYICIFEDSKKSKSRMWRVNVQVKGCVKKKLNPRSISHPMKIEDLKIYQENGGCLLFVVYEFSKDNISISDQKIYYQELTPVKLNHILTSTTATTKTNVQLKRFPQDPDDIKDIMINFYHHCRLQASITSGKLPNMEDLENKEGIEAFKIPYWGDRSKIPNPAALSGKDVYVYAKLKDSDILLPVNGLPTDFVDKQIINKPVTVDGKLFYSSYAIVHTQGKSIVQIGHSLSICFAEGESGCSLKYKGSNMLRVVNKDGAFMLAAIENQGFEINGARFDFSQSMIDSNNFDIENQRNKLHSLNRYVRMLDAQGCSDDIDLSKLSDEDFRKLDCLTMATLEQKPIKGLRTDLPPILTLTVDNLRFALWLEPKKEEPGTYYIRNLLDYGKPVYAGKDKDKLNLLLPVAIIFNEEAYLKVSNIRFEKLLSSFQQCPTKPYKYGVANDVMLIMINAYDKASGERKKKLYNTAREFAEWLCSVSDEGIDKLVSKLNLLQIKKRSPGLSQTDIDELYEMAETNSDREELLAGVYLLLDQHSQAKRHFNRMPEDLQERFKRFPIYHFWKE